MEANCVSISTLRVNDTIYIRTSTFFLLLNRTCRDSSIADVLEKNAGRQIIFRQLNTELIENNNVSRQYMTKIEAAILCQYYYLNGEKAPI